MERLWDCESGVWSLTVRATYFCQGFELLETFFWEMSKIASYFCEISEQCIRELGQILSKNSLSCFFMWTYIFILLYFDDEGKVTSTDRFSSRTKGSVKNMVVDEIDKTLISAFPRDLLSMPLPLSGHFFLSHMDIELATTVDWPQSQ
ncbi:hypothetical protein L1887_09292 [Cichorium endivia]|nr:hypothetical protein L1887_09292 [Cichorium endivia]